MDSKPPLLPVPRPQGLLAVGSAASRLVEAFLAGRNPRTLAAYRSDLEDFQTFLGAEDLPTAAGRLLGHGHGEANGTALAYRAALIERKLSPSTASRRPTALRCIVRLARLLGMVPWTLEVESVKSEPYRDTRGPGRAGFRELPAQVGSGERKKAHWDRAIPGCSTTSR
ncbi:MAG: hypothetical protein L0216_00955 [Planctomycetales bacterium]|nr:hypothetical protein [Planctomycetales bacterium]